MWVAPFWSAYFSVCCISVALWRYVCWGSDGSTQCCREGCPVGPGFSLSKVINVTPLLANNQTKWGLALDGRLKDEDTNLASSTLWVLLHSGLRCEYCYTLGHAVSTAALWAMLWVLLHSGSRCQYCCSLGCVASNSSLRAMLSVLLHSAPCCENYCTQGRHWVFLHSCPNAACTGGCAGSTAALRA